MWCQRFLVLLLLVSPFVLRGEVPADSVLRDTPLSITTFSSYGLGVLVLSLAVWWLKSRLEAAWVTITTLTKEKDAAIAAITKEKDEMSREMVKTTLELTHVLAAIPDMIKAENQKVIDTLRVQAKSNRTHMSSQARWIFDTLRSETKGPAHGPTQPPDVEDGE